MDTLMLFMDVVKFFQFIQVRLCLDASLLIINWFIIGQLRKCEIFGVRYSYYFVDSLGVAEGLILA